VSIYLPAISDHWKKRIILMELDMVAILIRL
jgi:hypothetical protein